MQGLDPQILPKALNVELCRVWCPQMRHTLLSWVQGVGAADPTNIPPFIRNKIAQLVVFVIQARTCYEAAFLLRADPCRTVLQLNI